MDECADEFVDVHMNQACKSNQVLQEQPSDQAAPIKSLTFL